eukprot:Em0007g339a
MNSSVWEGDIAFVVVNVASVLVCLLAVVLVFALKLYRKVVYRLALYQVMSSLAFATVETLQIIFINYGKNPEVYGQVCTVIGWFCLYTRWVKLLSTLWLVFHLFGFGALQKSLDKLEVLYVVTSVLVPLLIAGVPLVTNTYKPASPPRSYCYIFDNINDTRHIELAEKLGLWDGPAMIMLMAASIFMVVLVIRVTRLLWRKLKYEPIISSEDRYWTALKELLPLTAFPILFFIFLIPQTILHIYTELNPAHDEPLSLVIVALLCISLWSFASGTTLIIHLSLARRFAKKKALESRRTSYTRSVYGSAA